MVNQQHIVEEEDKEIWVKHYCSNHQILLVGDGDFSFSLCLAHSFGSASNIVASSLDSYDILVKKYKNAKSNLEKLQTLGAFILHEVDATKMKLHGDLKMRKFDRIIFNFPHAGFHGKEEDPRMIKKHKKLVQGFLANASGMLRPDGEVHVTHKTRAPYCHWEIEELARRNSLVLIESVPFKREDYPNYINKRGDSDGADKSFHLGECSTFKFRFCRSAKKISKPTSGRRFSNRIPSQIRDDSVHLGHWSDTFNEGWGHHFERHVIGTPERSMLLQGTSIPSGKWPDNIRQGDPCLTSAIDLTREQFIGFGDHKDVNCRTYVTNVPYMGSSSNRFLTDALHFAWSMTDAPEISHLLQDTRHQMQYHLHPCDCGPCRSSFTSFINDFPGNNFASHEGLEFATRISQKYANIFHRNSGVGLELEDPYRSLDRVDCALHEARNHT